MMATAGGNFLFAVNGVDLAKTYLMERMGYSSYYCS
jgi:hypothetical protein